MMTWKSCICLFLALLIMSTAFFLPLWYINLEAPQYPESLGMKIWIDTVTGANPHDLQNINILNHYIGMKMIKADSIPELDFMKYFLGGIIALGFIVLLTRKKYFLLGWITLSTLIGLVGLYDFYAWGYDYGHTLNPNAPIKIPGMTYQPPFIGSKKLLNITAYSYPHWGGILFGLGMFLACVAFYITWKKDRMKQKSATVPAPENKEDKNEDNTSEKNKDHTSN